MTFIADKEELKTGLVIFRRTDVSHRNYYCRVKLPKVDRYKTVSLKTSDITQARDLAFDYDADIRFRLKHDVPVFNRPFAEVAKEYVALQARRATAGEITPLRVKKIESIIKAQLNRYVGTTQVHLIGHDRWDSYPAWRRNMSEGRIPREGQTRELTNDEKAALGGGGAARSPKASWPVARACDGSAGERLCKSSKPIPCLPRPM